jgi:hypothetical protein
MPAVKRFRAGPLAILGVFLSCALSGCASESSSSGSSPYIQPRTAADGAGGTAGRPFDPLDNPSGRSLSLQVRAGLLVLGSVPYDGFVLPVVSPDGRFVATQTGAPPSWPIVLAEPDATPPYATVVEIYRIDNREGIPPEERAPPQLSTKVDGFVLLGRSADNAGFLIEAPQEDGSRWIGKASWDTGLIEWLVQGEAVNAFAAIAPDGRLAWSRRVKGGGQFDLVVRDIGGTEWSVPNGGGDWLMPVWSTVSNGVYAMHRQDGQLRLCYGQAIGLRAFQASLRDFLLIANSDKYAAYQAFISQGSTDGAAVSGLSSAQPQTLLLHPGLGRMMLWRPFAARQSAAMLLNARSLSALQQSADSVIIGLRDELLLQSLKDPDASIMLTKGTWVARRTPGWDCPYVLLSPVEGRVRITALKLLPRDTPAAALFNTPSAPPKSQR